MFLKPSSRISREEIHKIEQELNLTFPEDFATHYLNHNGGYPEVDTFIWENGDTTTINTFFSLKYDGFGNIEKTYMNLVIDEKYLPIGILVFANDDGGNFFCISVRELDFGYVYYCDNNHYDITNKEKCLTLLTKNFNTFLNNLS